MVLYALDSLAPSHISPASWQAPKETQRPSTQFITAQISSCLSLFLARKEQEHRWLPTLKHTLLTIQDRLVSLSLSNNL